MKESGKKNEKTGRFHFFVTGKVQGVFFRVNTVKKAKEENLTGWVRNNDDGRVEVVAEGKKEALKRFIEFLHKGPPSAEVENISIEEEEIEGEKDFVVIQ